MGDRKYSSSISNAIVVLVARRLRALLVMNLWYMAALTVIKVGSAGNKDGIHMFLIEGVIVNHASKTV